MEEVLVFILQVVFEVLIEWILYSGLDFGFSQLFGSKSRRGLLAVLSFGAGGAFGALANVIAPAALLPLPWLRIVNLIVGPPLVGWMAARWAKFLNCHGHAFDPRDQFWMGFWFALAFDVTRFAWAVR